LTAFSAVLGAAGLGLVVSRGLHVGFTLLSLLVATVVTHVGPEIAALEVLAAVLLLGAYLWVLGARAPQAVRP